MRCAYAIEDLAQPSLHAAMIEGPYLVTCYGFTAEPDFVFVLDRSTGDVVQKRPVLGRE